MLTNNMASTAANDDVALVRATLAGDREAFGRIVARYQALICTVTYSATGNLDQSKDLAQETFLTAWKRLADLREPEKLRSWLCGIARNLTNNSLRKQMREPSHAAEPIENISESHSSGPQPLENTISNEEQAILWRSLEKIPETYREPLMLFYRENQSVEAVAEKLELTPEAVHQRLSRGRKLLTEEVVAFVEGALARTAPGPAFTLAVLAALPVTFATSAKAATVAIAAAKGGASAAGGTFATVAGIAAGPMLGLLAGIFGTKMSLDATRTPRERAFIWRHIRRVGVVAFGFVLALTLFMRFAMPLWNRHPAWLIALAMTITGGYGLIILAISLRFNRRIAEIREQERREHPELFRDDVDVMRRRGISFFDPWEYRSRATLLGLPLVHMRTGRVAGRAQTAVGWIACGERAYGILFASGGVAVGAISMGGASVGLLSFGGFGVGLIAFGGLALGGIAFGGMAVGVIASGGISLAWHAAFGGVAAAHELAGGGAAVANHANDAVASAFFQRHPWLNIERPRTLGAFWLVCFLPMILQLVGVNWWRRKMAKRKVQN